MRHDLLYRVDSGPGIQAGVVYGRAEGLAEGGEGLFAAPDVDDGEPGVGAVADVIEPVWLVDDGLSCVEDLMVFLDWLTRELEDCGDGHGSSLVRFVTTLT